jgi:hypothetical protein
MSGKMSCDLAGVTVSHREGKDLLERLRLLRHHLVSSLLCKSHRPRPQEGGEKGEDHVRNVGRYNSLVPRARDDQSSKV